MATDLIPFSFESNEIRATQDEHGNPWFIAKDVCAALGIAWSGVTLNPIKDAWKGMMKFITPGGEQEFAVIREQAVYKLAFRSRKAEAAKRRTAENQKNHDAQPQVEIEKNQLSSPFIMPAMPSNMTPRYPQSDPDSGRIRVWRHRDGVWSSDQ